MSRSFLPLILSVVSNTVLAAAAERTRHALAAAKARGIKLGNPEQAKINRAKAAARAQALRPRIKRCIKAGRTSSRAIATDLNARGIAAPNGGQWFRMQIVASAIVSAYGRPGGCFAGRESFSAGPGESPRSARHG